DREGGQEVDELGAPPLPSQPARRGEEGEVPVRRIARISAADVEVVQRVPTAIEVEHHPAVEEDTRHPDQHGDEDHGAKSRQGGPGENPDHHAESVDASQGEAEPLSHVRSYRSAAASVSALVTVVPSRDVRYDGTRLCRRPSAPRSSPSSTRSRIAASHSAGTRRGAFGRTMRMRSWYVAVSSSPTSNSSSWSFSPGRRPV